MPVILIASLITNTLASVTYTKHGWSEYNSTPASGETSFDHLTSWLRSQGATVSPAMKLSQGSVRGIAARQAVKKGETLLALPPQLILSGVQATKTGPGCAVQRLQAECTMTKCAALNYIIKDDPFRWKELEIVAFLAERLHVLSAGKRGIHNDYSNVTWPRCGANQLPANFFDPYVETLPDMQALQSHPVFSATAGSCRAALNGTRLAFLAGHKYKIWMEEWTALSQQVPHIQQYGLKVFLHAKALLLTRAFGARTAHGSSLEPILVPLADMLNEDANYVDPGVGWDDSNVTALGFRLTSARSLPIGAELLDTYGDKPNVEMYSTYGFFFENQSFESVPLALQPFAGEVAESSAAQVRRILAGFPTEMHLQLQANPAESEVSAERQLPAILALARAMALAEIGMEVPRQWSPTEALPSLKLERRVLGLLHKHVEAQVRSFNGPAALASLNMPLELTPSLASASCKRYARLLLEPYGALLDFAETATLEVNLRLGLNANGSQAQRVKVSPLRKLWASHLFRTWDRQMSAFSNKNHDKFVKAHVFLAQA